VVVVELTVDAASVLDVVGVLVEDVVVVVVRAAVEVVRAIVVVVAFLADELQPTRLSMTSAATPNRTTSFTRRTMYER
jgi:hypothetical protein